jgi:carbonic anhydrase/acetyltransferase-like protein (isoleucine patch superfamily)
MIKGFAGKTPKIAPSAFIAEGAHIIGDVEIGENSSVWPGAVIRGDFGRIIIGGNTAIEDNAVIHSGTPAGPMKDVTIGDEVHIGHGAVINCHRIGRNTLIGMNATVLHDVEIGSGCIIGAGCLVPQGNNIPDGSFVVGVPGKIRGPVSEQQSFWIKEASQTYTRLVAKYREGGGL